MRRSTLPPPEPPATDDDVPAASTRHVEALDAAAGAAAGAAVGILAGPAGMAAGAVVGAAIGAIVGHALEQNEAESAQASREIDDIGRQDSVALTRRWASEMPPELLEEEVDDDDEASDGLGADAEDADAPEGAEPHAEPTADPRALENALKVPSFPAIVEEPASAELQRYAETLDRRATLAGRVLVSESPPEIEAAELDELESDAALRGVVRGASEPS